MRTNLKVFRVAHKLTQEEMAEQLGISRVTYSYIERGERSGTIGVWSALQKAFNVPDAEMFSLQKLDKGEEVNA